MAPVSRAVTGGNRRHSGSRCAASWPGPGLHVVLASRDRQRGESAAAELASAGPRVPPRARHHRPGQRPRAVRVAHCELGGADVLVNNAAVLKEDGDVAPHPSGGLPASSSDTNVLGALRLCQAYVPGTAKRPIRVGGERLVRRRPA